MKAQTKSVIVLAILILCLTTTPLRSDTKNNVEIMKKYDAAFNDKWKLVWSDEFNKDGLADKIKWNYEEGLLCSSLATKWRVCRR